MGITLEVRFQPGNLARKIDRLAINRLDIDRSGQPAGLHNGSVAEEVGCLFELSPQKGDLCEPDPRSGGIGIGAEGLTVPLGRSMGVLDAEESVADRDQTARKRRITLPRDGSGNRLGEMYLVTGRRPRASNPEAVIARQ